MRVFGKLSCHSRAFLAGIQVDVKFDANKIVWRPEKLVVVMVHLLGSKDLA
jgi:hypothetical protein